MSLAALNKYVRVDMPHTILDKPQIFVTTPNMLAIPTWWKNQMLLEHLVIMIEEARLEGGGERNRTIKKIKIMPITKREDQRRKNRTD